MKEEKEKKKIENIYTFKNIYRFECCLLFCNSFINFR